MRVLMAGRARRHGRFPGPSGCPRRPDCAIFGLHSGRGPARFLAAARARVASCGYVHEVVISHGADVIARHPRSYESHDESIRRTDMFRPQKLR